MPPWCWTSADGHDDAARVPPWHAVVPGLQHGQHGAGEAIGARTACCCMADRLLLIRTLCLAAAFGRRPRASWACWRGAGDIWHAGSGGTSASHVLIDMHLQE